MSKEPDFKDACPCGSDRTYEDCCWVEKLLDERAREIKQRNRRFAKLVERLSPGSEEEMQHLVAKVSEILNLAPQPDFKGLSSEQMHRILYRDAVDLPDVVIFNPDLSSDAFADAPIVKNAMFFLRALADQEPLKATARGNLPLAFARKMFTEIDPPGIRGDWGIRSEEDSSAVTSLRHILTKCGWMKLRQNKFSLTKKGNELLADGMTASHFEHLLHVFTRRFNWGYQDGYEAFEMIQGAWLLSMHFLHRGAREFIENREFFREFFRIFPDMLFGSRPDALNFDYAARCYSVRFLERFCEYFGFVESRQSKEKDWFKRKTYVRTTRLFDDYFLWQVKEIDEREMEKWTENAIGKLAEKVKAEMAEKAMAVRSEKKMSEKMAARVKKEAFDGGSNSGAILEDRLEKTVYVEITDHEIRLILDETVAGANLTGRFEACLAEEEPGTHIACFSQSDLEDLLGFVAAEANHARNKRLGERLDALADKLEAALTSSPIKVH